MTTNDKLREALETISKLHIIGPMTSEQGRQLMLVTDIAEKALAASKQEPTTCGHCTYEESDGSLIEQCQACKDKDSKQEPQAQAEPFPKITLISDGVFAVTVGDCLAYGDERVAVAIAKKDAKEQELRQALKACVEALEQQEPVGWFKFDKVSGCWHPQYEKFAATHADREGWKKLYTTPQPAAQDKLREAAQMALKALEDTYGNVNPERGFADEVEVEIKAAIAQAEEARK